MSNYLIGYVGCWAVMITAMYSMFPKFTQGVWDIGTGALIVAVKSAVAFIMMLVSFMS